MQMDLFVEISDKGPKPRKRAYGWIIRYITASGKSAERGGFGKEDDTTENIMYLKALIDSLGHVRAEKCEIDIYIDSSQITRAVEENWIHTWQQSGWRNKKGKTVEHAELWQKLSILLNGREIRWHKGETHEFKNWLTRETKRRKTE